MYLELKEQVNEHYEINHGNQIRLCPYVIHTYSTHLELCRYLSNYYICGINNLPPTRLLSSMKAGTGVQLIIYLISNILNVQFDKFWQYILPNNHHHNHNFHYLSPFCHQICIPQPQATTDQLSVTIDYFVASSRIP